MRRMALVQSTHLSKQSKMSWSFRSFSKVTLSKWTAPGTSRACAKVTIAKIMPRTTVSPPAFDMSHCVVAPSLVPTTGAASAVKVDSAVSVHACRSSSLYKKPRKIFYDFWPISTTFPFPPRPSASGTEVDDGIRIASLTRGRTLGASPILA